MPNKLRIDFKGVDEYIEKLKQLGGNAVNVAVENALKESQALVAQKCAAAMTPHRKTGRTAASIITDAPVEWTGETAKIPVGFDIENGGLASIFLMHGTTVNGQPHMERDEDLYNAVYGAETKREVRKLQKEAFDKVLEEVMTK